MGNLPVYENPFSYRLRGFRLITEVSSCNRQLITDNYKKQNYGGTHDI